MNQEHEPFLKFKGKNFLIKKPHIHAGEVAEFIDIEIIGLGLAQQPAMKFKGEYNSFFVFNTNEIQYIESGE